jgi:putative PEP-CTERM system TPR-repeat lipoprotein
MRIINTLSRHMACTLLAIVAGSLVACGTGASDKELVESAKSYMAVRQLSEATIELKNALQTNSKNAEARYLLGEVSMQVGNLASAEKEFQRALDMGWNAEAALIGKMRAMIAQREYKAVLEISNATNDWTDAAQANLLALKAQAYMGEGDLVEAKNIFSSAKALDANAYDVLKVTILLQLAEKQNKDAETTMSKAQKLFPENSELLLMSANLAMLNNQNEDAIRIFEKVIKLGPGKVMTLDTKRAYLGILQLAIREKDFDRVQKSRDAFAASNMNDPEVNFYLALAAFEEKNFDKAEEYLQKILLISSSHGPTLLLSGSVSYAKRDFEKAAYYLSKYVANYPEDNKARKLLGRAYMALGQNEDAQAEFNAVLNENADDAEVIALAGLSEISGGQVQAGITGLEKALAMAPSSNSIKLQLAKAYIADGQTDKAIKQLDDILQTDNNDQIKTIKVLAYLQNKDIEMAMNTARQMMAKSPDRADVLSLMGSIQLAASDTAAARKYFNRALNIDAGNISAEMNLARLDEQQGDIASAEKRYLSVLNKEPENIAVMTSLARLAAQQGDTTRQIKWLEAARQADKKELFSRIALVEIYLKMEKIADAEAVIRELEAVHSKTPAVLVVKGRLLMAQKRFTQAEAVISEFIDARPELDIGYYLQAQNQLALGDKKAALESVRKAYSLKPDALRNIILLASVEQSAGNYNRAMELGAEIISTVPDSAIGYVIKGDAILAMKKYQQALVNFDKAWTITKSREIALRRFKAMYQLSGVAEAAPVLTSWLEEQPDDEGVLLELATAYFVEKQNNKAVTYFEKVLVLQPDNVVALNNLAWLYGLENNSRALVLAKKAYALQPKSPSIIDTYGWVLLKNDKASEALTMLKQAADMLPDVPEVQYHYAKALSRTGDTVAANRILKALIKSGKAFDGRIDAEKMLSQ